MRLTIPARGLLVGVVVSLILWLALIGAAMIVAHAGSRAADTPRYGLRSGNALVKTIVVRGEGCMTQEDTLNLRLVKGGYRDGAYGLTAVYRCVRP